jgi:hypothetical protein
MKLLIVQLPPFSCYFILLWSEYSPQDHVLKHPQFIYSSLNVRDQVSHPYKTTGRITVLYILTFTFLDTRRNIAINQMENITTKFTVLS